jgi:hypothetical protein
MKNSALVFLVALLGLVFADSDCVYQFQSDDGKTKLADLSLFQNLDFSFAEDSLSTLFNLCGPVSAVESCTEQNAAVCSQTSPDGKFVSKGYDSMKTLTVTDEGKFLLSFTGDVCDEDGNPFVTNFELECAHSRTLMDVTNVKEVDSCQRVVTISSNAFCPRHGFGLLLPLFIFTALVACCCGCMCWAARSACKRSSGTEQAKCQKKCLFQRLCKRSGYQPVATQSEPVPLQTVSISTEAAMSPVLMYPPMFNAQMPFAMVDPKTFQENSDEAYARHLQEQINNGTA